MSEINKQAVLDVLNNLEVIEQQGGDESYILVDNNQENRDKLFRVGITEDQINQFGDDNSFCILALAFNYHLADEIKNGQLVLWGPIDDDLRDRVINGEGTPMDAERLLYALEPDLKGDTHE
jgi:hypothetical protein